MASKAVVDAVEARLGSTWNDIPVIPMNTTDEPPMDGSDYILLQFPASDTRRIPVTNRYYREEGGFRVVLHTQKGSGTSTILTLTDALAELFRDQTFSGVTTQAPSTPFFDDSNEAGGWFIAAIVVSYTFDFTDE